MCLDERKIRMYTKHQRKIMSVVLVIAFLCMTAAACGKTDKRDANVSDSDDTATKKVVFSSDTRIAYLGPAGTYTEEATQFFFANTGVMKPEQTVDLVIEALTEGTADYAVIPQENTVGGAVTNYVDALLNQTDVCVVGEVILPISQTLMGIHGASLSDIKIICSHAQGIAQSEQWRKQNLPDAEVKEMSSTAAAAEYVAQQKDKTVAAVAAPGAASLYGLEVLARDVQITDANKTRFYVLSRSDSFVSGSRAVFAAVCDADRIDDIIVDIHNSGLELVTIHDRPEGSKLGRYRYIIEVMAKNDISDEQIAKIEIAQEVRCLGRFDTVEKNNEGAN